MFLRIQPYNRFLYFSEEIPYKKFAAKQFNPETYQVTQTEINPDAEGYSTAEIVKAIEIDKSNLVLNNCGTGTGKSTAQLKLLKICLELGYIVLFITPRKSLVQKDFNYITKGDLNIDGIPESKIAVYNKIKKTDVEYLASKLVHIMTVSCWMRDAGEGTKLQNWVKSYYLDSIIEHCKANNKKIVVFLDELHEAIQYCKPTHFKYLEPWKKFIHKVIVSTATLSENCHPMIQCLSGLVNNRIHVIESHRKKLPYNRQADLEIYFMERNYGVKSKKGTYNLIPLNYIHHVIQENRKTKKYPNIQISVYSKELAEAIFNSGWLDGLDFNLATGSSRKSFVEGANNIGTTFISGINIKSSDLLIMVLPGTPQGGQNAWGTNRSGDISIIQGIARLRNGGKIVVIVPPVKQVIDGNYVEKLNSLPHHLRKFKTFENQRQSDYQLIRNYFEDPRISKSTIGKEILNRQQRTGNFFSKPNLKTEQFTRGQDILANTSLDSGKLVYPYFLKAACSGHFQNCQLPTFVFRDFVSLEYHYDPDDIRNSIKEFISNNYDEIFPLINFQSCASVYNSLLKIFKGGIVGGLNFIIEHKEIDPDLPKPNFNSAKFKQALLHQIIKSTKKIDINTQGEFIIYNMLNENDQLHWDSLLQITMQIIYYVRNTWNNYFPSQKVLENHPELRDLILEFGKQLYELYEEDPILKTAIWNIPKGIAANAKKAFRWFKRNFVHVSGDTTVNNDRVGKVEYYTLEKIKMILKGA